MVGNATRPTTRPSPSAMNRRFFASTPIVLAVLAVLAVLSAAPVGAQTPGQIENHPAAKVVTAYLRLALGREWEKAAALIEPESLTELRDRYVRRITRPGTTVEEEMEMVRNLGMRDVADVAKMSPPLFYKAYNTALQEKYDVTEEILRLISATLELRLLSLALEGDSLAHILVRTNHRDNRNHVTNLELISLRKIKGQWLVVLNAQVPVITPLDEIDTARRPLPVETGRKPPKKP